MSVPERDARISPPVFNAMPPAVLLLAGLVAGAGLLAALVPSFEAGLRAASVVVAVPDGMARPVQPLGPLAPFFLHVLVHFGGLHIAMNLAVLIGAGRPVGAAFGCGPAGSAAFLVFFLAASALGGLAQIMVPVSEPTLMGGASSGVSGLLAAAGWVTGGWRGMARLALPWIALNLLIALTGYVLPIPVGWAAHIGGTLAGVVLTPVFLVGLGRYRGRPPL
ncbi:rhomboid family intramembrane serine protease [Maricaulis sp. CAU 1757]